MATYIKTCSEIAYQIYVKNSECNPTEEFYFVDVNPQKWNSDFANHQVVSVFEMRKRFRPEDCFIVPEKYYDENLINQLEAVGFSLKNDKIFVAFGDELMQAKDFISMDYLEFHVNDHCNLNCKACSHFSPLVKNEIFTDFETFKKDLEYLNSLIKSIKKIRIMGGEPLLNKQLTDYISFTRRLYPYSDIRIVTNGILLEQQNDEFWDCLRSNKVKVDITIYPALYNKIDEYISLLKSKNIEIGVSGQVYSFIPPLREKGDLMIDNTSGCFCVNVHDGKIATCPMSFYGKYFNEYFDKNVPFESGQLDLYSYTDGHKLKDDLNKPFELCKYCNNMLLDNMYSVNSVRWESLTKRTEFFVSDWCRSNQI